MADHDFSEGPIRKLTFATRSPDRALFFTLGFRLWFSQSTTDSLKQRFLAERFVKESACPRFHRTPFLLVVGMGGDENNGNPNDQPQINGAAVPSRLCLASER